MSVCWISGTHTHWRDSWRVLCALFLPLLFFCTNCSVALSFVRLAPEQIITYPNVCVCVCVVVVYGSCRVQPLSSCMCVVDGQCHQELCALLSVINSIFIHDCSSASQCECHCLPVSRVVCVCSLWSTTHADSSQRVVADAQYVEHQHVLTHTRACFLLVFCVCSPSTLLQLELLMAAVVLPLTMLMMLMMCSCSKWGNLQKCFRCGERVCWCSHFWKLLLFVVTLCGGFSAGWLCFCC